MQTETNTKPTRLVTYNAAVQHYGQWLSGYEWAIYGTGTFRDLFLGPTGAIARGKRFFERMERRLGSPIPYVFAMENRYSGLGLPQVKPHIHFLAAGKNPEGLAAAAQEYWESLNGNAKVRPYAAGGNAAFYVAKLATHSNGHLEFRYLDLIENRGQSDLLVAARENSYVPDHLKHLCYGESLALR